MNELAPIDQLPLPVVSKANGKQKKALAEAAAFSKFGIHPLRIKTSVLAQLGQEAEAGGIKNLGNGRIIVAAANAEDFIAMIAGMVAKIAKKDEPDYPMIVELSRLVKEFNGQLITSGQTHLQVARAGAPAEGTANISVPFPAGSPLMLAVGQAPTSQT